MEMCKGLTSNYKRKPKFRVRSSRWWHRMFLTSVPLTRRPTSNYSQEIHHCEILKQGDEAEAASWTTDTKKDCIVRVRGIVTLWLHPLSSRMAQCHNRSALWTYGFLRGVGRSRWKFSFPSIGSPPRRPTQISHGAWLLEIRTMTGNGAKDYSNQCCNSVLADWIPTPSGALSQ